MPRLQQQVSWLVLSSMRASGITGSDVLFGDIDFPSSHKGLLLDIIMSPLSKLLDRMSRIQWVLRLGRLDNHLIRSEKANCCPIVEFSAPEARSWDGLVKQSNSLGIPYTEAIVAAADGYETESDHHHHSNIAALRARMLENVRFPDEVLS